MKKQGWMILSGVGLAVVVATTLVWRNGSVSPEQEATRSETASNEAVTGENPTGAAGEQNLRQPASIPSSSLSPNAKDSGSNSARTFPYEKELKDYIELKAKVFMSDEDKRRRAELLANANFLRSAGELLKRPADLESEEFDQQARAMDLLLEALSSPSKYVAAEVLRSVVEDPQIEDEKLDLKTRQALAGVKGEVMYHWSAMDPEGAARNIPSWLPGPVSRKIWQNVIEMQEENLRESAEEM